MVEPTIIKGGIHTDERGTLHFVNDFDMTLVKRFYTITHADTETRRGWRGHRIEQRWFYVSEGVFEIEIVEIDDWHCPNPNVDIKLYMIQSESNELLHVPSGYATRIRAIQENSKVILFADYGTEHAKLDDHLWPVDYFKDKK